MFERDSGFYIHIVIIQNIFSKF